MKKKILYAAAAVFLLGSCAKEAIEPNSAPQFSGESRIIATYGADAMTKTHLENGEYKWDMADALGVFSYESTEAATDETNAIFKVLKVENGMAEFSGSYQLIVNESCIVYYPYASDLKLNNGTLALNIPARQNFNHDVNSLGGRNGSFDQAVSPLVGKGVVKEGEDGKSTLDVTLNPVTPYIYFPIKGSGKIKKLELSIEGKKLNGSPSNGVDVLADTPSLSLGGSSSDETKNIITLNCGQGVDLKSDVATNFWFVVPVMNVTTPAVLTVKINGNAATLERKTFSGNLQATYAYRIGDDNKEDWFVEVNNADEDAFIVDSESKFLEYAYAATVGENIPEIMKDVNENLKTAKIVKDLDFSRFEFATDNAGNFTGTEYRQNVAKWYATNGNAIPTIGGAKLFKIVGAKADATATQDVDADENSAALVSIKGLTVKGNGLFDSGYNSPKRANHVENISLSDVTVNGNCYLTSTLYDQQSISFTNVNVNVQGDQPLFGTAYTNNLSKIGGEYSVYANTLQIIDPAVSFAGPVEGVALDLKSEEYNTISIHQGGRGAILYVKDAEDAKQLQSKVSDANWYSMMNTAATTSYWTGTIASDAKKNDSDVTFTAEELAYVASRRNVTAQNNPAELNVNIDLMGKEWTATADAATVTVAEGKNVTISNVVVKSAYLLAETGTATGVNVEADYSKAEAVDGYVGGLFLHNDANTAATTTGMVKPVAAPANVTFGTHYGYIDLTLNGNAAEVELVANFEESEDAYVPYGAIVCSAADNVTLTEGGYTNVKFTGTSVNLEAVANHIVWNWKENARIPKGYRLILRWNNSDKEVTYNFIVNSDETLAHAIREAAATTDESKKAISMQKGEYGNFSIPSGIDNLNGVTIDADGSTFKGRSSGDLKGATIKNANFENNNETTERTSGELFGAINGNVNGTFDHCTFTGKQGIYFCTANGDVTFRDCTFSGSHSRAVHIEPNTYVVLFEDCTFNGFLAIGEAKGDAPVTFRNCYFGLALEKEETFEPFAGANFWGDVKCEDCCFAIGNYAGWRNWQWIDCSYINKTYEFTNCYVNSTSIDDKTTKLDGNYIFRISGKTGDPTKDDSVKPDYSQWTGSDTVTIIIDGSQYKKYATVKTADEPTVKP